MKQIDTHKGIIAWFARNHVAANLLMFVIVLTGIISALTIRTQITPDLEADRITIDIPFPGASPGEVESGVISRLEEAIRDIEGIEQMRTYSRKSMGTMRLDLESDAEIQVVMDEVKIAIDRISSFPSSIEKPIIYRAQPQVGAINIQVFGELDERSMKEFTELVRDEILSLTSVTKAELRGARPYEIAIELKEEKLRQYGLTLSAVAQAIRRSSLDLPAGVIQSDSGDILLRTEGLAYNKNDFERIVLVSKNDGTRLTLGDIAIVSDGFIEQEFHSFFNGKPSIGIAVYAVSDQNQIEISKEVKAYIEKRKVRLPEGINLEAWGDSTAYLSDTVDMMVYNMLTGVLLVLVVLGVFLRLQLAFWVMLGMPIAFLGAFALLPLAGGSINLISLFGFILVLGIVVDDAIIIGESVQSTTDKLGPGIDNVIIGAKRVATPATFGVLTTVVTFIPLLLVPGTFGAMPEAIGIVVILCLLFSIIESKLILPAHLASMSPLVPHTEREPNAWHRFQSTFALKLKNLTYNSYRPLLQRAIAQRYITVAIFVAMLILALGVVMGPYIRTVFFPNMSSDYIRAEIEMVDGASTQLTTRVTEEVATSLIDYNDSLPEEEQFLINFAAFTSNKTGMVMVEMKKADKLQKSPEKIASEWRTRIGEIAGTKKLEISGAQKSHGNSSDIEFKLVGQNTAELNEAADVLERTLKEYVGVYDIENSNKGTTSEINLQIKASAEALGLSLRDLADQVRAAFYGVEAQRIQRGREEIKVMVRYPKSDRESRGNLDSMYIRTDSGDEVPFESVAEIEERMSPSFITRTWGKRSVRVSANVEQSIIEPGKVVSDMTTGAFRDQLELEFPGVRLELGGASQEQAELQTRMLYTALLALFGIYALMAIPLKSYLQPLIIMGVIPFGMIGAMIGHLVVGIDFSALSLCGIVALAGVVVNDSIIMVDFVNKSVEEGMAIAEAAVKAGTERFRAIMLTSLTTFFGLLPILLETSFSAQLVIPMAVSLGFGILFATVITLILIPCLYIILDDINSVPWAFWRARTSS